MDKKKIVFIDDEPGICELIKLTLEKTGKFAVETSSSASAGIELVKSSQPDLVLLDIVMPEMNGAEVAEILSAEPATKHIPIAFLTALVQETEVTTNAGVIGQHYFISKTVGAPNLIQRIEQILATAHR